MNQVWANLIENAIEAMLGQGMSGQAPSNFRADLYVTWKPRENLELTAGVANIFDDRHPEFSSSSVFVNSEVPRTFYAQATFRF